MRRRSLLLLGMVGLLTLLTFAAVAAQSAYNLDWWTIDAGGRRGQGAGYALEGVIGQPETGTQAQGGAYTLSGGFWTGGIRLTYRVSLPVVMKSP